MLLLSLSMGDIEMLGEEDVLEIDDGGLVG
jgi:hypothetical protein